MTQPEMLIVAGPPGAGKSSVFPLPHIADRVFNADDRAAQLNGGSYGKSPCQFAGKSTPEHGCPLPSLAVEMGRADDAVREVFQTGLLEIHSSDR